MDNDRLGIVFTGGEGPDCPGALLEEARAEDLSPLVAAADSGLFSAEAAGVKPDWIIGDMDSIGRREAGGIPDSTRGPLAAYRPEQILRYPADKDYTDTELAVSLLREKGCRRIWIVGGGGGRIDHLFAIRSLFERGQPPERWITSREDIRCIQSPGALECDPDGNTERRAAGGVPADGRLRGLGDGEKPYPVSVFPLGEGPWKAASRGLKWSLTGLVWDRGFFGVSNEATDGAFTIYAEKGSFMVILPL
ncbi:MAG: thiamine pyrophosphokinase [Treponema sp.]|jgi:thiamine pyrophosphokinase|nr:thiamine pyrophosphokinase [Treponema sp.]